MLSISISFGGAEGKTVNPAEGSALRFADAEPLYSFLQILLSQKVLSIVTALIGLF